MAYAEQAEHHHIHVVEVQQLDYLHVEEPAQFVVPQQGGHGVDNDEVVLALLHAVDKHDKVPVDGHNKGDIGLVVDTEANILVEVEDHIRMDDEEDVVAKVLIELEVVLLETADKEALSVMAVEAVKLQNLEMMHFVPWEACYSVQYEEGQVLKVAFLVKLCVVPVGQDDELLYYDQLGPLLM